MADERPVIEPIAAPRLLNDAVLQTAAFNVGVIADQQEDEEFAWQLRFVASLLRGLAALPRPASDGKDSGQ